MKKYQFIQYRDSMKLPDGIYNALYNKDPSIIRITDGKPVFVQHIGNSRIFDPKGIILSSVELLLPAQEI